MNFQHTIRYFQNLIYRKEDKTSINKHTQDLYTKKSISRKTPDLRSALCPIQGNRIILIDKNGNRHEVKEFPNLQVIASGKNSLVEIYESNVIKNKLYIQLGENCYCHLGNNNKIQSLQIVFNDENCTCFIGSNNYIRNCSISGGEPDLEFCMGNDCVFSIGINIRCSDAHTVFSLEDDTHIINRPSFGIHIGNHVWIGQNVAILKDTFIPDDCIVGFGAVVTGKPFSPHCAIAGNPARIIKKGVSWSTLSISKYEKTLTDNINNEK